MSRRQNQLSQTLKSFSSFSAILHLFGNSWKHALDALLSEQWQEKQRREEAIRRVPLGLQRKVRALLGHIAAHRKQYAEIQREGLLAAGWSTLAVETIESLNIVDLESDKIRATGSCLVCNFGFVGMPGKREWRELAEHSWVDFIVA